MSGSTNLMPIVSKIFCSPLRVVLFVRKRPHLISGGGFVVMDGYQRVIFRVEGCGILGVDGELIVRDGDGTAVLFIRKKVTISYLTFNCIYICILNLAILWLLVLI